MLVTRENFHPIFNFVADQCCGKAFVFSKNPQTIEASFILAK
jgi:hypothetical protein